MVNLFLVVIATQFSETKRRETEKIAEERKRYKSSTTLTSMRTESEGCYNQLLKYLVHVVRRNKRKLARVYTSWKQRRAIEREGDTNLTDIKLNVFSNHIRCQPCPHLVSLIDSNYNAPIASPEPSEIDTMSHASYLQKRLSSSPRILRHPTLEQMREADCKETAFSPDKKTTDANGSVQVRPYYRRILRLHRSISTSDSLFFLFQMVVDSKASSDSIALLKIIKLPSPNKISPRPSPTPSRKTEPSQGQALSITTNGTNRSLKRLPSHIECYLYRSQPIYTV